MTRQGSIAIRTEHGELARGCVRGLLVVALAISFSSRTFAQTQPENSRGRVLSQASDSPALSSEQRLPRGEHQHASAVLGVLRSEQGTPLGGSRVFLWAAPVPEKTKTRRTAPPKFETIANADGMFVFRDVPPGTYTLRAIFGGFEVLTKEHILINPGAAATVELPLKAVASPVPNRDLLPREAATDDKPIPDDPELLRLSGLIQRTETEAAQQQAQQGTGEGRDVNVPLDNRWGYGYPDFRRYPGAGDSQFVGRHWYDPFNTNKLKGDIPVLGNDTFLTLGAASETFNEVRHVPLAPNRANTSPS